jgi:hypothetical protein
MPRSGSAPLCSGATTLHPLDGEDSDSPSGAAGEASDSPPSAEGLAFPVEASPTIKGVAPMASNAPTITLLKGPTWD